jgi:hypothetical protein
LYVKDKNRIRFSSFGDLNISILEYSTIKSQEGFLLRMLLVFLILPINMVFVILIQLPLMERARFLTNWNSKIPTQGY